MEVSGAGCGGRDVMKCALIDGKDLNRDEPRSAKPAWLVESKPRSGTARNEAVGS